MEENSFQKRSYAAAFFAAAAYKLLPNVQFIESNVDQLGFYYDVFLPYPLIESQLEEIERIATEISSNSKVSFKEMMLENAKNYLEHFGQIKRRVNTQSILVHIIEIDDFKDFILVNDPIICERNYFIKLYKLSNIKENIYRVYGFVFQNSKEYSKFLKKFKAYEKNNCKILGKKRLWFDFNSDQFTFFSKGVILKNKLLKMISKKLVALGYKPIQTYPNDHVKYLLENPSNLNKVFEIIYGKNLNISENDPFNNEINLFIKQTTSFFNIDLERECISCLQSIVKMLNILSFRCEFVLLIADKEKLNKRKKIFEMTLNKLGLKYDIETVTAGCALNIYAKDRIERKWKISSLNLNENSIESYFCSSLNRWIALLAENSELNFQILPEHVRAILLDEKCLSYAKEIKNTVEDCGFNLEIDNSDKSLNEKVFLANEQEVPFIIVIGEKESNTKTIALRLNDKTRMQRITLCELLEKLKQKGKFENQ
jgi:threonyl-tRNA synthetase